MPAKQVEAQVRGCIESFVEELSALVTRAAVESVQEALGGSRRVGRPRGTGAAKVAPTAKKRGRRGKRLRRSTEDVEATSATVLDFVRGNPGLGVIEISEALGSSPKDLRLPVKALLADGLLKTTGQRRGTKYHAGSGRKKAAKKARGKTGKRRKTS